MMWHMFYANKEYDVLVENGQFSPWTENQYPQIESQIPNGKHEISLWSLNMHTYYQLGP